MASSKMYSKGVFFLVMEADDQAVVKGILVWEAGSPHPPPASGESGDLGGP